MDDQTTLITIPTDNAEGFLRGAELLKRRIESRRTDDVTFDYDALSDRWSMRLGAPRPSVSYFAPQDPRFILRLDEVSGELTGVDLTRFKASVLKTHPQFREFLPPNVIQRLFHRHEMRRSSIVDLIGCLLPSGPASNHHQYA